MDTPGAGGVGGPPYDDGDDARRTGRSLDEDRALQAMAAAARRAGAATSSGRSPTAATGWPGDLAGDETIHRPAVDGGPALGEDSGPEPMHHELAPPPTLPEARPPSQRRLRRVAEAGIAVGLLVVAIVLIALYAGGGSSSSRTRALARAGPHPSTTVLAPSAPPTPTTVTATPPTTAPPVPTTTVPTTTTTVPTTTPPPPGGGPQLSSVSPAQGGPGQVLVVSGANLISSDGQILARFNGQSATTRCPTRTSCDVTVPAIGGAPSSVALTVTTAEGTSNPVAFSYSG